MTNSLKYSFRLLTFPFTACLNSNKKERAIDPWVVRINLDGRPNMLGLALNKEIYAAYDGKMGAFYKVWEGNIKLAGPVYDYIHKPQPQSEGESYIQEELGTSPWSVSKNNKIYSPRFHLRVTLW